MRCRRSAPSEPAPTRPQSSPPVAADAAHAQPGIGATRCQGEPLEPLALARTDTGGEARDVTVVSGRDDLPVIAQFGESVFAFERSCRPGAMLTERHGAFGTDRVASISNAVTFAGDSAFLAWLHTNSRQFTLQRLPDHEPVVVALPHPHEGGDVLAVGVTSRYEYLATWEGPRFAHHVIVVRATDGNYSVRPSIAFFDAGLGEPIAVIADNARPTLLVATDDANTGRALVTLRIDLGVLDGLRAPSPAASPPEIPATAVARGTEVHTQRVMAAATGIAQPPAFFVASTFASVGRSSGEPCDGVTQGPLCFHAASPQIATVAQNGALTLEPPIADAGVPRAIFTDSGAIGVVYETPDHRFARTLLDAARRPATTGLLAPTGSFRPSHIAMATCGGQTWAILAGRVDTFGAVAAVPANCGFTARHDAPSRGADAGYSPANLTPHE